MKLINYVPISCMQIWDFACWWVLFNHKNYWTARLIYGILFKLYSVQFKFRLLWLLAPYRQIIVLRW